MKRILPFALLFVSGAWMYACSSSSDSEPSNPDNGNVTPDGSTDDVNTKPTNDAGDSGTDADANVAPEVNPIEGAVATAVPDADVAYVDGLIWADGSLYFTEPYVPAIRRYNPDGSITDYVTNVPEPLGITYDGFNKKLLVASALAGDNGTLMRVNAGNPEPVNVKWADGKVLWQSPNDVVVGSDGTIYVTDPSYQTGDGMNNGVYRVSQDGTVTPIETFEDGRRPNGIALSPKADILYVSFTQQPDLPDNVTPTIVKYAVNADGSTGARAPFVNVNPVDAAPDGLAVDTAGNVYVAMKDGVQVFAPNGTKWAGDIKLPDGVMATNVAFGGDDFKTLYISTNGGLHDNDGNSTKPGLYTATVKVAGLDLQK